MKRFQRLSILIFLFFLPACQSDEVNPIIEDIKLKVESGIQNFFLDEITDFDWNEVCVFYPADDYPKTGYLRYKKHQETNPNIPSIDDKNYTLILLFKNSLEYKVFTSTKHHIKILGQKHVFRVSSEIKDRTGGCLTAPVTVENSIDVQDAGKRRFVTHYIQFAHGRKK